MTSRPGINESTDRRGRAGACFGAALAAASLLPAAAGGPVLAQEAAVETEAAEAAEDEIDRVPNPLVTLGVSSGLRWETDEETAFTTELELGYLNETRSQRLSFDATGLLDLSDDDGADDLRPRFNLSYGTQNRSTALSFDASYARREVDGNIVDLILIDDVVAEEITADDGIRVNSSASLGLVTGRDARFGTTTRLRVTRTRFEDTEADNLDDRDVLSLDSTLRFTISPVLETRLTIGRVEIDEDDGTDLERERTRLGVGATMALDRLWTLSADVTRAELDTTRGLTTRTTETEDGLELALSLSRAMPNGTLGFALDRDITEDGDRSSLQVQRALELPDGASLSLSLGAIAFDDGDETRPFGSLAYSRPTRRGAIDVALSQSGAVNSEDESILRTSLNGSFRRELTPRDDLILGLSYIGISNVDDDDDDAARAEVSVSHRRALSSDWGLTTRLSHQVDYEDGDRDDEDSILSLRLGRTFTFRP